MAWRKSRYQLAIEKRQRKNPTFVKLGISIPRHYKKKLEEISGWEKRPQVHVLIMLMGFGFEVYDRLNEMLAGKLTIPENAPSPFPHRDVIIEAIGRANLVDHAAKEFLKRNREWLMEREAEND